MQHLSKQTVGWQGETISAGKVRTLEAVSASPEEFLDSVTVMVQREAGYDPENNETNNGASG